MSVRDYPQGALEALSRVKTLFEGLNTRCQGCPSVQEGIEHTLDAIERGAAVDFSFRLDRSMRIKVNPRKNELIYAIGTHMPRKT